MALTKWFKKHNSRRNLIVCTTLSILALTLIYTRYFGLVVLSNDKLLDMVFVYDNIMFFDVLHSLTNSEIVAYKLIHLADYVFAIGFYPLLAMLLSKLIDEDYKYKNLIVVPLISGLFDILENLVMDIHLYTHPSEYEILGSISGAFTALKFSVLIIALLIISILFYKKRKAK